MIRTSLNLHPDNPETGIKIIRVGASRYAGEFTVWFRAAGSIDNICVPKRETSNQKFGYEDWMFCDELWQSTCFEAFMSFEGMPGYVEINLATSVQWASYQFSDYRTGMKRAEEVRFKSGSWGVNEHWIEAGATFVLPDDWRHRTMQLGLAAIIEEKSRKKSFWAIRHASGRPDFHHPDCFALTLEAPPSA